MGTARLTALRLVGFKSFAEKTVVEFGPQAVLDQGALESSGVVGGVVDDGHHHAMNG